jgi:polysaccharide deacetylase family protein (PEP-CTERM system associated)
MSSIKEKDRESLKCAHFRLKGNVFSVDLEDYFMVSSFEAVIRREDWQRYESRIENNTYHLLEILDSVQTSFVDERSLAYNSPKATFFCLGWVAEQFPHLIKEIHSRGHEIASHGYNHRMLTFMSQEEFREDIRKTKAILEDLIGEKILGYRAPSYSINRRTLWALEILAEEGYLYDSSIFPIHHDRYGIPDAPRYPFQIEFDNGETIFCLKKTKYLYDIATSQKNGRKSDIRNYATYNFLIEFPISTLRIFGYNLPIGGGGYFRIFPLRFTLWALRQIQGEDGVPFVFYIHPWEIDPLQPRVRSISPVSRFRHYVNLGKTNGRLEKLLRAIPFSPFCKILEASDLNKREHLRKQRSERLK